MTYDFSCSILNVRFHWFPVHAGCARSLCNAGVELRKKKDE